MTITRRWQAGFESDGSNSMNTETDAIQDTGVWTNTTEAVKTGSYALMGQSSGGLTKYVSKSITRTQQGRFGAFFMHETSSGTRPLVTAMDSGHTGDDQQFCIYLDCVSGFLKLYTNDGGASGDLQDTGTTAITRYPHGSGETFPSGGWYHIGIDFKLDGAAGWIKVYLDGVEELSITGDVIFADMSGYVDALYLGSAGWGSMVDQIWDDLYFDDTTGEGAAAIVPSRRFHYLRANANGNYSQLTGSDGDSTNNFLLVDEMPHDSDTTYVGDTALASTLRDSYGISTITLDGGASIAAIIPVSFARKGDAGTNTAGVSLRYGGTDWDGGTYTLTTSYAMLWDRLTVQPGGTKVWDQASLNSVEAGVISYP